MFSSLHPNIRIRIYTSFLSRLIGSMIFPFMAIYFTREMNATTAGILLLINVIVQFLSGIYGGHLADSLGRKKLMVIGEGAKVLGFAGMLLANTPLGTSAVTTFLMLLVISIASGMISPAQEAMLIDVSTKESRAFMYSINYWANNLSMMLGLMIGGWFFQSHMFLLLIVLVIMAVITLSITMLFIQETYVRGSEAKQSLGFSGLWKSYQSVWKDTRFLLFVMSGIAILSLEFQRSNYITVRMSEEINDFTWGFFNWAIPLDGVRLVSLLTVENTLLIVLLTALVTKLIAGRNERAIMYTGFILFGVGFSGMAVFNQPVLLLLSVAVLSIGELMYVPTRQSLLADMVDETKRGAYMAFHGFVFQIGKMVGALGIIAGEVIGKFGMASSYLLLVFLGILFSEMAIKRLTVPSAVKQVRT